jgi:hypothetical protein
MGTGLQFCKMERVLEMGCGDSSKMTVLKTTELST